MHNYQKRLYQLRDELIRMNELFEGDYDINFVDTFIEISFDNNMEANEFYEHLEAIYKFYKNDNHKIYHTIAMMLIYC